jgi:hypothetical protein
VARPPNDARAIREIGVEDFCEGFLFYFLFYFEASSAHASLIGKIALKSGISPSN